MKVATLYIQNPSLEVEELSLDKPHHGEVLIRNRASGICQSDWRVISGETTKPLPVVLFHEGAGIVEEIGEVVTSLKPGEHVVLSWAPICSEYYYCLHGQPNLCQKLVTLLWEGTLLDGISRLSKDGVVIYHFSWLATFAEKSVVPVESCIPVREDVPFQSASLVAAL